MEFPNNGVRDTEFCWFDDEGDDKYRGISVMDISQIFVTQDLFSMGRCCLTVTSSLLSRACVIESGQPFKQSSTPIIVNCPSQFHVLY